MISYMKIYKYAVKSREFQILINNKMKNNEYKIPIHFAFGHEFISALVKANFDSSKDKLFLTHRNIHFTSIFSKDSKKNYFNFKKKKSIKLSFGSMNYLDKNSNIIYTSSILGNNLSVACGYSQIQKKNSLTFCVIGDGGIEEGTFYETILLAKYLNLNIIFIIENNNWSMFTSINQRRCKINLQKISSAVNCSYYYFKRSSIKENIKKFSFIVNNSRKVSNPVICEFDVKTIGSYKKNNRFFNYHHGPMNLEFEDKIFFKKNYTDILYLMKTQLTE